jgi:MADS-box transcription factor
MGRRKIEIKAIKDDRNRSVTFLKRKGGLFKKAHELSVLCSVDVAVIIYGTNKKLYEYSSSDMHELLHRYSYHAGPHEHKGPVDFNGREDDEEEDDATPPRGNSMDPHPHAQMMGHFPPQFPPHVRQHTQSASPPIISAPFHPHNAVQRSHTPQPHPSRPASRTDMRRIGGPMMPQTPPIGPPAPQPVNGYAYMPQPPIYQPQSQMAMAGGPPMHQSAPGPQYPYGGQPTPPPQHTSSPMPPHGFVDDRRPSVASSLHAVSHSTPSPPRPVPVSLPPQQSTYISPPPPSARQLPPQMPQQQAEMPHRMNSHMAQPPSVASMEPENDAPAPGLAILPPASSLEPSEPAPLPPPAERPPLPILRTTMPKKLPQRKGHSIFTPIDDNRTSILSQHFSFFAESKDSKSDPNSSPPRHRLGDAAARRRTSPSPLRVRSRPEPISEEPSSLSASSSRSDSLKIPPGPPSAGVRPQLKVQIPITASEANTPASAGGSVSPQTATSATVKNKHNIVLPPPSPSAPASASALLSAGATGPPNPFARPPPQNRFGDGNGTAMNVDTPASALPSRFLNSEFLPSPSGFYQEWSLRANNESNTLPSPLNFTTPLNAAGPSFLREEPANVLAIGKRKSPDISGMGHGEPYEMVDAKRVKVE